ncbi:cyclic beta 1-2 glucan synthetase, partial [Lysobacter sp. 2RAB21]
LMAWLGRPPKQRRAGLSQTQLRFLGRLARRTWAFFEVHIREEDHWLPPDNFQEHPTPVVARRTSPTNIGLSLLANLSAYDLGYVQAGALIERTRLALATLETLPRHRGHFYNWYDTATLLPLPPRYISTVDSGNLAAHLLTLRQGLLALADEPLITPTLFQGLADTCGVLEENLRDARAPVKTVAQSQSVAAFREHIDAIMAAPPQAPREIERCLAELSRLAQAIESAWPVAEGADADIALRWPRALSETCRGAMQEFEEFLPAPSDTASDAPAHADATMPSLRDLAKRPNDDGGIRDRARRRIHELEHLAHIAGQLSLMEYEFLYDRARHLLSIGYNVEERRLDAGFYDLLA